MGTNRLIADLRGRKRPFAFDADPLCIEAAEYIETFQGAILNRDAALAASAARIEALTEALRGIEAHLADHWNCGAVQLFLIASRALVTARAVLNAAPRSDDRKSDEFWSFTNGIGR